MYLPSLNKHNVKRRVTDSFRGINKSAGCKEDCFYSTKALCSRLYPALSTEPTRYILDRINTGSVGRALFFMNKGIGYVTPYRSDIPDVYSLSYKGNKLTTFDFMENMSILNILSFNSKTLFVKQDYAYEFDPDFSTPARALSKVGYTLNVQAAHTNPLYSEATLRLSLVYEDMTEIGSFSTGVENSDFPADAEVGDCYMRNAEYYRLIYKDSASPDKNIWQPIVSFRLRLNVGDGYRNFKAGDYVRLSYLKCWNWSVRTLANLNRFVRIDSVDDSKRYITEAIPVSEDTYLILQEISYPTNDIGYGSPIINNVGNDLYILEGSVSACMPSMDMICTGANRVWGCSSDKGEIYASELGSHRNWSVFEGGSGDSYAVTVGSSGNFTACCSYLGTPIFFKENEMIVITGSRPASFTLNSYSVRGVATHSPEGLYVVGDTLYYMASDGVYAYNGASTTCISRDLGEDIKALSGAVFSGEGDILFICGELRGEWVRFSYDTVHRIWHSCPTDPVTTYLRFPDATLEVSKNGNDCVLTTMYNGIPSGYGSKDYISSLEPVWSWESNDISYSTPDKKYLRRLSIDSSCDGESEIYISYDGDTPVHICSVPPHTRTSRRIHIFPRRCDHFRVICSGRGKMILYSVTKDVEEASENG